jgi:hypothetical protein
MSALKYFYGGDMRGPTFTHVLFSGSSDYTECNFQTLAQLEGSQMAFYLDATNYKDHEKYSPGDIHPEITSLIINTARFHASIDNVKSFGKGEEVITATNSNVMKLLESLQKSELSGDEKDFFSNVLGIFKRTSTIAVDAEGKEGEEGDAVEGKEKASEWTMISVDELKGVNLKEQAINYRVNLMKHSVEGKLTTELRFAKCLPVVPTGGKIYGTTGLGEDVAVTVDSVNILRTIYMDNYKSGAEFNVDMVNSTGFSVVLSKLVSYRTKSDEDKREELTVSHDSSVSVNDYKFLEDHHDIVSGHRWIWDSEKKQYFRESKAGGDTVRVYYDDANLNDPKKCYGLYLKNGDEKKCRRLIDCLVLSDTDGLIRCLDIIGDGDLFEIAMEDFKKVEPKVALAVLRKFGILKIAGKRELMSYEKWMNDVVSKMSEEQKKVLKNNTNLLSYIRGLMYIWNNSHGDKDTRNVSRSRAAKDMGIRTFYRPTGSYKDEKKDRLLASLNELRNKNSRHSGILSAYESGLFNNVHAVSSITGSRFAPMLVGGSSTAKAMCGEKNSDSCSGNYRSMVESIKNGLENIGMPLSEKDKQRLTNSITTAEKREKRIEDLMSAFKSMISIAREHNLDYSGSKVQSSIRLEEVSDMDQLGQFLKMHIAKTKAAIKEQMETQMEGKDNIVNTLIHILSRTHMGHYEHDSDVLDGFETVGDMSSWM